jgi:hypothetical protein
MQEADSVAEDADVDADVVLKDVAVAEAVAEDETPDADVAVDADVDVAVAEMSLSPIDTTPTKNSKKLVTMGEMRFIDCERKEIRGATYPLPTQVRHNNAQSMPSPKHLPTLADVLSQALHKLKKYLHPATVPMMPLPEYLVDETDRFRVLHRAK